MMFSKTGHVVLSVCLLLFCESFAASAETPQYGGTLYVSTFTDAWNFDPIHVQTTTGQRVFLEAGIGETLYRWSFDDQKYEPWLATALPEISDDGKVYRIPLRQGVRFHDGTTFDAYDMVYSFERILNPENKTYVYRKYVDVVESVEAIDEFTLKITLQTPDNAFIAKLAGPEVAPVSQAAVEAAGEDYGTKRVIGTGPFRFVEWLPGDRIVLERFDDYWQQGLPYLDRIVFKIVPDETTALLQLRLGEVHILDDVPRKSINLLKQDAPNLTVTLLVGIQHEQIYLNTARPPFDDIRIRRAVAHAIDRQAIIDSVFDGYAIESVGPYHSWAWTHHPDLKQPYPYNPEKAGRLLKEAGYGPDNPLRFELMATNQEMFVDQAVMVQAYLKDVGVQVEVLPLEKSTLFDRVYVRKTYKDTPEMYAAALEDWGASVDDPESSAERLFQSDSGGNKCFYKNREVDTLFSDVNFAKTVDEQKAVYYKTEQLIASDVPTIWICNPKDAVAYRNTVKGFHPDARYRLPLATVWLEQAD